MHPGQHHQARDGAADTTIHKARCGPQHRMPDTQTLGFMGWSAKSKDFCQDRREKKQDRIHYNLSVYAPPPNS